MSESLATVLEGFDPNYDYAGLFRGQDEAAARAHMETVVPPEHRARVSVKTLTTTLDGNVYTQWYYMAPSEV